MEQEMNDYNIVGCVHWFTIEALKGQIETTICGDVPGGVRLHVTYTKGIKFSGRSGVAVPDLEGEILGGSDWVLLRKDGVATFDGVVTFAAEATGGTGERHVFDGAFSGVVDLTNAMTDLVPAMPIDTQNWERLNGQLEVVLPVRFETAGPAEAWASEQFRSAAQGARPFRVLGRRQFAAVGALHIEAGRILGASLDICELHIQSAVVEGRLREELVRRRDRLLDLCEAIEQKKSGAEVELLTREVRAALAAPGAMSETSNVSGTT
jgi:hypothetical protein